MSKNEINPVKFEMVVAMDAKHGIGLSGHVPWSHQFKPHTQQVNEIIRVCSGQQTILIMGRKAFFALSINSLLENNLIIIVVSKTHSMCSKEELETRGFGNAYVVGDLNDMWKLCNRFYKHKNRSKVVIIGGRSLYEHCLESHIFNYCYKFHLIYIKKNYNCDMSFPYSMLQDQLKIDKNMQLERHSKGKYNKIKYVTKIYVRSPKVFSNAERSNFFTKLFLK